MPHQSRHINFKSVKSYTCTDVSRIWVLFKVDFMFNDFSKAPYIHALCKGVWTLKDHLPIIWTVTKLGNAIRGIHGVSCLLALSHVRSILSNVESLTKYRMAMATSLIPMGTEQIFLIPVLWLSYNLPLDGGIMSPCNICTHVLRRADRCVIFH